MNALLKASYLVAPSTSGGTLIPGAEADRYKVQSRAPSWAASNLATLLGGGGAPTQAEMEAAKLAIYSIDQRNDEDIDLWAREVGRGFGSVRD